MDKQTIKNKLYESHHSFIDYLNSLSVEAFLQNKHEKWSPAQQLQHIYLGIRPVRQILSLPNFFIQLFWGKANRDSKSYDQLVTKYLLKLENGGRATGRFIPKTISFELAQQRKKQVLQELEKLSNGIDKLTEDKLDQCVLPHPLLGRLTIREMLYFLIYHVKHHEQLTKRNLVED